MSGDRAGSSPMSTVPAAAVALALAVLVTSACGPARAPDDAQPGTTVTAPPNSVAPDGIRSAPRWETVTTFSGDGAFASPRIEILSGAVQWRVRYTCSAGALLVTTDPAPRRPGPMVDATCPQAGEGYSIVTGPVRIAVEASGPWTAVVDQQVETPLDEARLPGMVEGAVQAAGDFYRVEKDGRGTARLYRLGDGRRFLRLEGFETAQNTDLFVWLSEAVRPGTSREVTDRPRIELGNLKSTLGNQNYEIPESVPDFAIRSIVIWCAPLAIAYTAADMAG